MIYETSFPHMFPKTSLPDLHLNDLGSPAICNPIYMKHQKSEEEEDRLLSKLEISLTSSTESIEDLLIDPQDPGANVPRIF